MSSSSSTSSPPPLSIHVYVAPFEYDQIFTNIKKYSKNNIDEDDETLTIQEHFENFIQNTIFTTTSTYDDPATFLFHSKKSRQEIFPLLLKISEAMPELFEFNIVTKRLLQIINKMCIKVPLKPTTENDEDEEEDYEETMINDCASIISNTSGDISRNHAAQIFRFFDAAGESKNKILAEFKLCYGPSFVTVITASILWPGATAFSCLLILASKMFSNNEKNQELTNPCLQLLFELYQNCLCLDTNSEKKEILEIGCGLGLLSTSLASQLINKTISSSSSSSSLMKIKTTDLFESAAKNASENVKRALLGQNNNANSNTSVEVDYAGLNWKEYVDDEQNENEGLMERIIIGSEVFFDEDMSRDVAKFLGTKIHNWKVAYLVVLENRVGAKNFPNYCKEFDVNCELFPCRDFFAKLGQMRISTEVEIGTGENAIGKAVLEDWVLIKLTR